MSKENEIQFDLMKTTDTIRQIIQIVLSENHYETKSVEHWNREIINRTQNFLSETYPTMKSFVSTIILPRSDEDIHLCNACLWDTTTDGSTIIK